MIWTEKRGSLVTRFIEKERDKYLVECRHCGRSCYLDAQGYYDGFHDPQTRHMCGSCGSQMYYGVWEGWFVGPDPDKGLEKPIVICYDKAMAAKCIKLVQEMNMELSIVQCPCGMKFEFTRDNQVKGGWPMNQCPKCHTEIQLPGWERW